MWGAEGSQIGGGGGFLDNSQFDSPSESKRNTGQGIRKSQNLVHSTVAQILTCTSDPFMIGRIEVNLVRMVARVKSVEVSSTKIKYQLEDDTGTITAISWLDGDAGDSEKGPLVENTYCRVVGSVRSQEGVRYVMLLQAEPVNDPNLITNHLIGVIHNELMANKPSSEPVAGQSGVVAGPSGAVAMPAMNVAVKTEGGTGNFNERVMEFIKGYVTMDEGVSRADIVQEFKGATPRSIDAALEFLCNEGQIYTTVDDDHFKSTDG